MYYQKMIGLKIKEWKVIGVSDHGANKQTKMLCQCSCGTIRKVDAYSLKHGFTNSCGKCKKIVEEENYLRCIMKNGTSFIFDQKDIELVKSHSWSIARGYVRTSVNGKSVYLHQMIMNEISTEVDHKNGNPLDNRRSNLRIANHCENNQNKGLRADNTTGYKGVCYDNKSRKFVAYINAYGKRTYLGYFEDKKMAAKAYDNAAIKLHGEYARPNFV